MYTMNEISRIGEFMLERKETLSVAESVTAGHLQAALSLAGGAMQFFEGGITTYTIEQKVKHLGIDPIAAIACNCVSKDIAGQMALGVQQLFSTTWGIAITGYASRVPEANIDSLFAFYAFVYKGRVKHVHKIECTDEDPFRVQQFYTAHILQSFCEYIYAHALM
jgi:PncC family amidohydrolase